MTEQNYEKWTRYGEGPMADRLFEKTVPLLQRLEELAELLDIPHRGEYSLIVNRAIKEMLSDWKEPDHD